MRRSTLHLAASALILVALVLIVTGLPDRPVLWWAGLAALAVAFALSLATRWARDEAEPPPAGDAAGAPDEVPPP